MGKNTLRSKLKASKAGLCLLASDILDKLGLPLSISDEEICRALGVTVPESRAQQTRLRATLERNEAVERLRIEGAVLRYRVENPDCWCDGEVTTYSNDLCIFVLALAERVGVGEWISQKDFAELCKIPLPVLTAWWAGEAAVVWCTKASPPSSPEAETHPAALGTATTPRRRW